MAEDWVKYDTKRFEQGIAAADRGLASVLLNGVKFGAEIFNAELRRRILPAKRVNVQDEDPTAPKPGGRPTSVRHEPLRSTVTIRAHWVVARSPAIINTMQRVGQPSLLNRPGLWIGSKGTPKDKHGYPSRSGLRFVDFGQDPRLYAWAHRRERGYQLKRHTIYLASVEARRQLQATPSLRRIAPRLLTHVFQEAKAKI